MTDYLTQVHGNFGDGQDWSCGLHVTSNQNIDTLVATMQGAWIQAWTDVDFGLQTLYPVDTVMTGVSVHSLTPTMRWLQTKDGSAAHAGTALGDSLPIHEAVTVNLRSDFSGPSGRGRIKLPALEETFVNGNLVTVPAATRIKTAIGAVLAAIRADGSSVFVFNDKELKDLTPPFRKRVITQLPRVDRKPGTQRNRANSNPSLYV